METGVHGQPGIPAARPVEVVPKPGHVSATTQLHPMVEQPVLAVLLNPKLATPKLVQQVLVCLR